MPAGPTRGGANLTWRGHRGSEAERVPGPDARPRAVRRARGVLGISLIASLAGSLLMPAWGSPHFPAPALRTDLGRPRSPACPGDVLRLPPDAVAGATGEVLTDIAALFPAIDTTRSRVALAARAPFDPDRGPQVKRECGEDIWRRTVVVHVVFPKMRPSASLSQGVVFVGLGPDGYFAWEVAH